MQCLARSCFDLRFPDDSLPGSGNIVVSRFVGSLTFRGQSARKRSERLNGNVHRTGVRWCWVRVIGRQGRPHYHSCCCSISMRTTRCGVFSQRGRVSTVVFKRLGPAH
ncbi:hypothetical protein C1751_03140 [Pseudomonas fluorescens]|nr:hypothetical protein C1751_03140 [Pseudomonas fluorescens]